MSSAKNESITDEAMDDNAVLDSMETKSQGLVMEGAAVSGGFDDSSSKMGPPLRESTLIGDSIETGEDSDAEDDNEFR